MIKKILKFPAPREVDRYLYTILKSVMIAKINRFPAPLEVDR